MPTNPIPVFTPASSPPSAAASVFTPASPAPSAAASVFAAPSITPALPGVILPPVNGSFATVTINPAGGDNSVIYTANAVGTAGNDITVGYATPAVQATTTVQVAGNAITVTPGTKAQMIVTGTLTSNGSTPVVFGKALYAGLSSSKASYKSTPGDSMQLPVIRWNGSIWILMSPDLSFWHSSDNVATPDLVTTWVPQGSATGTPVVTAGVSRAEQVITEVNASSAAAALVTASASGTVTGSVAAVSATNLSGGASGPSSTPPSAPSVFTRPVISPTAPPAILPSA